MYLKNRHRFPPRGSFFLIFIIGTTSPCFSSDENVSDEIKQVVKAYVEGFNSGDMNAVIKQFSPDGVVRGILGWEHVENIKPIWRDLKNCFNITLQVESIASAGDVVAVKFIERGKSVASFRGGPVTRRSYEIERLEWFQFKEGVIQRYWQVRDSVAMFEQMNLPFEKLTNLLGA